MNDKRLPRRLRTSAVLIGLMIAFVGGAVEAQQDFFQPLELGSGAPTGDVVKATGVFTVEADGKHGRLFVTADIAPGWHIYSVTQKPGGPVTTSISVKPVAGVTIGKFTADDKPHAAAEPGFDNMIVETHESVITWTAPMAFAEGVDPTKLELAGRVFAQACEKVCLAPQDYKFAAKAGTPPALKNPATDRIEPATASPPPPVVDKATNSAATTSSGPPMPGVGSGPPVPGGAGFRLPVGMEKALDATVVEGSYKPRTARLQLEARLEPAQVTPGGKAKIIVTMKPDAGWHVYYAIAAPLPAIGNQATALVFTETSGLQGGFLSTEQKPVSEHLGETSSIPYFEQPVTWSAEVDVPATTQPGEYRLAGTLGFQTCEGNNCLAPEAVSWETVLNVGSAAAPGTSSKPLRFLGPVSYRTVHAAAFNAAVARCAVDLGSTDYDLAQIKRQQGADESSLATMLGFAFLAGFILNFMPCVLPVIGLKVLSFVEQGGHDPRRVFLLNLWYSLGMIFVFVVLATIPVVLRIGFNTSFGWGEQFSYDIFNIILVAIVFVMALSFLGVWEIPIPGFAGSRGVQQASSKEGLGGAFVKGAITTVLATPCSGPFLGTAVAFALRESPPVTYAIFIAMGLGMAAPYLLVGLKPGLVRFLPKPGEWMDTFKQVMGFVLVGTAIWLMVPIHEDKIFPTLILLAGLGVACWWIGRTPNYAESHEKLKAWGMATAFAGVIGWLAFAMPQVTDPLPWRHDFAMNNFVREVDDGKTVMIEFTAEWCLTCKSLKAANLDRSTTKKRVEQNGVVTYEVDIDKLPEAEQEFFLRLQGVRAVPLIAIFPANKKYEPILFGGGYTQSQILEALDTAGPSKATTSPDRQVSLVTQ
ncbi:MAG: cytochrome c biogenesis protein CcdA [Pirellulales bacterium]